jgi:hypothetical protein
MDLNDFKKVLQHLNYYYQIYSDVYIGNGESISNNGLGIEEIIKVITRTKKAPIYGLV